MVECILWRKIKDILQSYPNFYNLAIVDNKKQNQKWGKDVKKFYGV